MAVTLVVDALTYSSFALHVNPYPGTKWISIGDLCGIAAMNFSDTFHACIVSYPRESSDASTDRAI